MKPRNSDDSRIKKSNQAEEIFYYGQNFLNFFCSVIFSKCSDGIEKNSPAHHTKYDF